MARVYDWLEVQTRRPFLLQIHGHVHSAFGRSGRHLNVASGGVARAMIVNLTTLESIVAGPD